VAILENDIPKERSLKDTLISWLCGSIFIIGLTLGAGKLILGYYASGFFWLAGAMASGWYMYGVFRKKGWGMTG
jgi:hypothetical protein